MLKRLDICGLFGVYSYSIDWAKSDMSNLLFLTGPNGMGKSTILRLIRALFRRDFTYICSLPYERLLYEFDADVSLVFEQSRVYPSIPEGSDVASEPITEVRCICRSKDRSNVVLSWRTNDKMWSFPVDSFPMLNILLESSVCRLLSDERLFDAMRDNDATHDPQLLKTFFSKLAIKFSKNLSLDYVDGIQIENDVEKRIAKVLLGLKDLERWDMEVPVDMNVLLSHKGPWMDMLVRCENALWACREELDILRAFEKFVNSCGFMEKSIRVSSVYGYRVFAHDEVRTILPFEVLSSGEKQVICQIYSLLFKFESHSLVLIDEPEISYHMMWQMQYLKTIQTIASLRQMTFLIATHSPQMFDGKFGLTIDLYRQYRAYKKRQK